MYIYIYIYIYVHIYKYVIYIYIYIYIYIVLVSACNEIKQTTFSPERDTSRPRNSGETK